MSIHAMIAAHPDVAGRVDEELATAARHAMFCAVICTSCADACSAEPMEMRQCIRLCMDCADVCTATAAIATRRTGSNAAAVRAMLAACIETCERCAAECEATIMIIAGDAPRCAANARPIAIGRPPRCRWRHDVSRS